jgi:hypothetical protein
MLDKNDISMFMDELFDTIRTVSQLEYKVDRIAKSFEKLYLKDVVNEEEFWNLKGKLAKIRLMLTSEDV